ncbi:MAG: hypothetical protein RSB51_05665 [Clostridia bacterium]
MNKIEVAMLQNVESTLKEGCIQEIYTELYKLFSAESFTSYRELKRLCTYYLGHEGIYLSIQDKYIKDATLKEADRIFTKRQKALEEELRSKNICKLEKKYYKLKLKMEKIQNKLDKAKVKKTAQSKSNTNSSDDVA